LIWTRSEHLPVPTSPIFPLSFEIEIYKLNLR
jgi:hypothetical protein